MRNKLAMAPLLFMAMVASACSMPVDTNTTGDDEQFAEVVEAIADSNALTPNAMNPNAMNPNAMNPNAMSVSALSTLGFSALVALQDNTPAGALSRQFADYAVSCALSGSQAPITLDWVDAQGGGHHEVWNGLLGLAPGWRNAPLDLTGQKWVTACMASRANWYMTPVIISSRGPTAVLSNISYSEKTNYSNREGAFFGNIFAPTPTAYACYDDVGTANADMRDCASGHLNNDGTRSDCGPIHVLGPCSSYASDLNLADGYYGTANNGYRTGSTTAVITTYVANASM